MVELDLAVGRHSGVPLETRGAIARYDAARDVLELHGAAKVPHWNRDNIARMLGRAPASVHLFEGHVGGGFGIRGELYPEDVLVCVAALRLGHAVKWIEDRREHLIAANHSRQQRHKVRAAVDAGGRVLAIDDEFFHDQGGYVRTHAATVPDLTAAMLPGPYRVPAYRAIPMSWNTSGFDNHGGGTNEDFPDTAVNSSDREFHFTSMLTVQASFQFPPAIKLSE